MTTKSYERLPWYACDICKGFHIDAADCPGSPAALRRDIGNDTEARVAALEAQVDEIRLELSRLKSGIIQGRSDE